MTRFPVEKSGEARIGGGERSEPISRMFFMPYDTESQSRNADFISIAPKGETTHYILRVASAPSKCVRCAPQSDNPQPSEPFESSRRNQITLSAPHKTVRAVFPHTALRIVLGYHICTRIRGFGI